MEIKPTERDINQEEIDRIFETFWRQIVCTQNGKLIFEQVKKELYDFYFMMSEVPKVYSEVTGGLLSKPMYYADSVIECFRDYLEERIEEEIKERAENGEDKGAV